MPTETLDKIPRAGRYSSLAELVQEPSNGEVPQVDRRRGTPLEEVLDDFVMDYRRLNRRDKTIHELQYHLTEPRRHKSKSHGKETNWDSFLPWCQRNDIQYVEQLDKRAVLAFIDHIRTNAAISVWHRSSILLNKFLIWANTEANVLPAIPCKIPKPRMAAPNFEIFTDDEVIAMHNAVKRENSRDYAMFLVLLETGIRRQELLNLTLDDVRLDRREIVIRAAVTKTWEGRTVPIEDSVRALRAWLRDRTDTRASRYFFLPFRKTPVWSGGREKTTERRPTKDSLFQCLGTDKMRPDGLEKLVKRWGRLGSVTTGRCSPHTFRHYFAVRWLLDHPGDIRRLQYLLGHKKLETTAKYLRFVDHEGIRDAYVRKGPIRHLMSPRQRGLVDK